MRFKSTQSKALLLGLVDEAAIFVCVVFMFLTDQPRVHGLVTCSVVFPEACLSLIAFLLKYSCLAFSDG